MVYYRPLVVRCVAPLCFIGLMMIGVSVPLQGAMAACAVTSGGGSISLPANDSVIVCDATPESDYHVDMIGYYGRFGTLEVHPNVSLSVNRIVYNGLTLSILDGAQISNVGGTVIDTRTAHVTMGDDARIVGERGIYTVFLPSLVMGDGASIVTTGAGVVATSSFDLTLGENSVISAIADESYPYLPVGLVSAGYGSEGSHWDIDGTVRSNGFSLIMSDFYTSDDTLTLRSHADLDSGFGADGKWGYDTINLVGSNSEDEYFSGFEELNVNADLVGGWELLSDFTGQVMNLNSGTFTNNVTHTFHTVNLNGGVYKGTGTTAASAAFNNTGATVAPGNSIGTMTIDGDYVQGADGILEIEVGPNGADKLVVTGDAVLGGTLNVIELEGGAPLETYIPIIETTGFRQGLFDTWNRVYLDDTKIYRSTLFYRFKGAELYFEPFPGLGDPNADGGACGDLTSAGTGVCEGINDLVKTSPTQGLVDVVNALQSSGTLKSVLASQSNSVQVTAGASAFSAGAQVVNVIDGRFMQYVDQQTTYMPLEQGDGDERVFSDAFPALSFWAHGLGGFSQQDGDAGNFGYSSRVFGGAAGLDATLNDGTLVLGAFGAYTRSFGHVDGLGDDTEVNGFHGGLYAQGSVMERLHLHALVSGARLDFKTLRSTPVGVARGTYDGMSWTGQVDMVFDAFRYENTGSGEMVLSPFAGLGVSHLEQERYDETGAGVLNLSVYEHNSHHVTSKLGVQLRASAPLGPDLQFHSRVRLGWAHAFRSSQSFSEGVFASTPGIAFSNQGVEIDQDALLIDVGTKILSLDKQADVYFDYTGTYRASSQDHRFAGGVRMRF